MWLVSPAWPPESNSSWKSGSRPCGRMSGNSWHSSSPEPPGFRALLYTDRETRRWNAVWSHSMSRAPRLLKWASYSTSRLGSWPAPVSIALRPRTALWVLSPREPFASVLDGSTLQPKWRERWRPCAQSPCGPQTERPYPQEGMYGKHGWADQFFCLALCDPCGDGAEAQRPGVTPCPRAQGTEPQLRRGASVR